MPSQQDDGRVADALSLFTPQTLAETVVRVTDERDAARAENEVLREALDKITWAVGWDGGYACEIAREALTSVKG